MKFFKSNLRYLRRVNQLNQADLGKIMGLGRSMVADYENEEKHHQPKISAIEKLCRHFGISSSDLLDTDLSKNYHMDDRPSIIVKEETSQYHTSDLLKEIEKLKIENSALKEALQQIGKGLKSK